MDSPPKNADFNVIENPDRNAFGDNDGNDKATGDAADTTPPNTGQDSTAISTSEAALPASAENASAAAAAASGSRIEHPAIAGGVGPAVRPAARGFHVNGDDPANISPKELEGQDNLPAGQLEADAQSTDLQARKKITTNIFQAVWSVFRGDGGQGMSKRSDMKVENDAQSSQSTDQVDELLAVVESLGVDSSKEAGNDSSTAKKILVFGSAGTGKTSFVNALSKANMATGSGARGVTFASDEVRVNHDGVDYQIIDTVGLNETAKGRVSGKAAIMSLRKLLQRMKGGINLIIMVMPVGRVHESTLDNYKLFVETMTAKAVPLLVVVTHCEREAGDMQDWVRANREDILSRGIDAKQIVATTFVTPDPEFDNVEHMQKKVDESVEVSWNAIRHCATITRVDFMAHGGLLGVFRDICISCIDNVCDAIASLSELVGQSGERAEAVSAAKPTESAAFEN